MKTNANHSKLPSDVQLLRSDSEHGGNMKNRNRHFSGQHQTADRNVTQPRKWKWMWRATIKPGRLTHSSVWAMSIPHYTIISHRFFCQYFFESVVIIGDTNVDLTATEVEIATEKPEIQHKKCQSIAKIHHVFYFSEDCISLTVFFSEVTRWIQALNI